MRTTLASGTATIGVSGTAGLGTMVGGALEASNINISGEFSNLIIAQRAFEANSKAVTVRPKVAAQASKWSTPAAASTSGWR